MSSLTIEQWIYALQTRFSFAELPDSSNPYVKAMHTFQSFTNDIASALRDNDTIDLEVIDKDMLHRIYDGLPSFYQYESFRDWVKDATLKHPHRRTLKQYQWLCIVGAQQQKPSKSKADLVHMILEAGEWPYVWARGAYDTENLLKDPESQWFFRNKNGIKAAKRNKDDHGGSCLICANNFDAGIHLPQRAPCGHCQCRRCFQESLKYALGVYSCAFCRACLVCGGHACQHHVIPHDEAPPHPLGEFLKAGHYLCADSCTVMEPLHGLTPERYWTLREFTRKNRSMLTKVLWLLAHNLAPEHRVQVEQERDDLYTLLESKVETARKSSDL
ncbi:uncharacterized protein EKO05_0003825 [Ascochyta rabiei]|uniref:Uncharacterized protein n=1 Tax=Didymella rabiei TaxID=5454 RepID=A0A163BZQ8_DIDRA|nr:uncharacterized protein EKO05_0003825 [Ascochyta rabiei]KZM22114.1 hypothetical protein ST47_g6737 [Ascochyta rabiei]UPX13309.1 hypothetical protein EKO05_0003825 [Ascochyta rabiei]